MRINTYCKIALVLIVMDFLILNTLSYSGTPHAVAGVVQYSDGSKPSSLTFTAYMIARSGEKLYQSSVGCGYDSGTGQWVVQCGNFPTAWSAEEELHIEFDDGKGGKASDDKTLTNNPVDDAGTTIIPRLVIKVKVFLQGSYQAAGDTMTTTLNDSIPLTSPYSDSRTVSRVPSGVTDWVYVELRTTPTGSSVAGRSFFLKRDGYIIDEDGITTDLPIPGVSDGDYYIIIRHRNHLAVMSTVAQSLNSSMTMLYNFTIDASTPYDKYYGGDAALLESGVYGMYAGDGNDSGVCTVADGNIALASRDSVGYYLCDYNMSGIVTIADVNLSDSNRDKTTAVN